MGRSFDSVTRELVLQYLYCRDIWKGGEGGFDKFVEMFPTARRKAGRARAIIRAVVENIAEIDAAISKFAETWPLHRMSIICRNILRIGTAELMFRSETPFKVILDEAVELAKHFDNEATGSFVNGILDQLARVYRAAEVTSQPLAGDEAKREASPSPRCSSA
jgi:transcription antitermination factor NusB